MTTTFEEDEQGILALFLIPNNPRVLPIFIPDIPVNEYGLPTPLDIHHFFQKYHHRLGLNYLHPICRVKFISITDSVKDHTTRMHLYGWGDLQTPLHIETCNGIDCTRGEGDAFWRVPILGICVSEDGKVQDAQEEDAALMKAYFRNLKPNLQACIDLFGVSKLLLVASNYYQYSLNVNYLGKDPFLVRHSTKY
ncbi:uncharacterized protein C8R40DRAFT_1069428 [Lentinula edodes]|uniref:uncharacterized protein n=1 Tax=Lentinula edodes TaxID=5353 RepID=UPI001E8DAACB|nr:uncharacterized protein C8R40DRAFT_1069428 [Lentinula edodes]KAH7875410.1 hypothetical protein C8R40DRAFT_1069428 [Lentinula edodes]